MMWFYHFDPQDIIRLYQEKQWDSIVSSYSPAAVARVLGYENAMNCMKNLRNKEYAETLLFVLHGMYPECRSA